MLNEPRRCKLFAPPHLSVRVVCEKDHILSGLFIVMKLVTTVPGDPWEKVARVMEGTEDPGEAPRDPKQQPRWERQRAAALDRPHDPSDEFVVAFVDDDGYLVPVHEGWNPWFDASTRRDPDSYKLGLREVYSACLVRHPDPELARAVARHLNGAPRPEDERYGIADWGELVSDLTVEQGKPENGDEYVFRLPEAPEAYFPRGNADYYGGWLLYFDMPHAMCGDVPDQVEALQKDLAVLRYPTGDRNPFEFRSENGAPILDTYLVSRALADRTKFANEHRANPKLTLDGAKYMQKTVFRVQTQVAAAVARFQEHVRARKAFELGHKDAAHGGQSWTYLLGTECDAAWEVPQYLYPGVVDAYTAGMIDTWKTEGLRKPGQILVETLGLHWRGTKAWSVWMRHHAAIAVNAWSELVRMFDVAYGAAPLFAGSACRRPVDNPWPGSIKNSPHNSGLAVDLQSGGRTPDPKWPVRVEAEWVVDPKWEKGATPEARAREELGNLTHNLFFKLYGHSTLDVFGDRTNALKVLREKLVAYVGPEEPKGKFRQGTLYRKFRAELGDLEDPQIDEILEVELRHALAHARALIALLDRDPNELIARYFRRVDDVLPFAPNPYEADGGTSAALAPDVALDAVGFDTKSWVNISALAYEIRMERIPAHKDAIRDARFVNPHRPGPPPLELSVLSYMIKSGPESDLVSLLLDLTSRARENVRIDDEIVFWNAANKEARFSVQPRDLDRDFIRDWRDKLLAAPLGLRPRPQASTDRSVATGAQLSVVRSAFGFTSHQVEEAAKLLDAFGGKRFVVAYASANAVGYCPIGTLITGADAAKAIRKAAKDFAETVKSWQAEDAQRISEPRRLSWDEIRSWTEREAARTRARAVTASDWTLVLQPVFLAATKTVDLARVPFLPTHTVVLPRSSSPNHLEWWHFQLRDVEPTWGEAAEEVGWSKAFLEQPREGPAAAAPVVHRGGGFQHEVGAKVGGYNLGRPGNSRPAR
jgi:hypothetical protein